MMFDFPPLRDRPCSGSLLITAGLHLLQEEEIDAMSPMLFLLDLE